jgi:hypothetical protein
MIRRVREKENPLRSLSAKGGIKDGILSTIGDDLPLPQLSLPIRNSRKVSVSSKIPVVSARPRHSITSILSLSEEPSPVKEELFRSVSKNLRSKIVRSSISGPPEGKSSAAKFDEKFRERVYVTNALLKAEENSRFAQFKEERLSVGTGRAEDLDYDSDSGSVFETPRWMLEQCQYYSAASDNERRRRKSRHIKKPENLTGGNSSKSGPRLSGRCSGGV